MVTDLSRDGRTLLFSEVDATRPGAYALYARKADGSPAVRLGDGLAAALAPDGRHALSVVDGSLPHLVVWPAGAGESRSLPVAVHVDEQSVNWMPDGRRILFAGREGEEGPRLYVQEVDGGAARPVSARGLRIPLFAKPVSPDGRTVAAVDEHDRPVVQDLDGGDARPLEGLDPGDLPIRWAADGGSLYVHRFGEFPGRVFRFDLAARRKALLTELVPADAAGVAQIITVQVTADGRACAFSYKQNLSDLYLVGGLR
jgi:dipeptidyl aminopeptidase/acylaminoacyl peptidase